MHAIKLQSMYTSAVYAVVLYLFVRASCGIMQATRHEIAGTLVF